MENDMAMESNNDTILREVPRVRFNLRNRNTGLSTLLQRNDTVYSPFTFIKLRLVSGQRSAKIGGVSYRSHSI